MTKRNKGPPSPWEPDVRYVLVFTKPERPGERVEYRWGRDMRETIYRAKGDGWKVRWEPVSHDG